VADSDHRARRAWGAGLGRTDVVRDLVDQIVAPVAQFTLPHNVMGTPAMSPLAMHVGLPIGVQLITTGTASVAATRRQLEQAMPWARVPPLHGRNCVTVVYSRRVT
jgi:Asp-tRNA(Asn)/Glu-tRNA(Gln) amidotransferase A subunit family amidase